MGWRSTGGAFRAGNYNGPLTSDEGGFASGFAKTFTAGISKASDIIAGEKQAQRDQKREEDLIRLRETLAAQRAAATASRSTEKLNGESLRWAIGYIGSQGLAQTAENIARLSATYASEGNEGRAANAADELVAGQFLTLAPRAGQPPAPLEPVSPPEGVVGLPDTAMSFSDEVQPDFVPTPPMPEIETDDLESTNTLPEKLTPVEPVVAAEDTGEVAAVIPNQSSGPAFDITPQNPAERNILNTLLEADLNELRVRADTSNPNEYIGQAARQLYQDRRTREIIQITDEVTLRTILQNGTEWEQEAVRKVFSNMSNPIGSVRVRLGDGTFVMAQQGRGDDGKPQYVDMASGNPIASRDVSAVINPLEDIATYEDVTSIISRANSTVDDARNNLRSYISAADSAYKLTQVLARSPDILTIAGGVIPSTISNIESQINGITTLFGEEGEERQIDPEQVNARLNIIERDARSLFENGMINKAARDRAIYLAQEKRLAYAIARSQQGPAGVISNQDFNTALESVRASIKAENAEESLRQLITADETNVRVGMQQASENDAIRAAQSMVDARGMDFPLVQDMFRTIPENFDHYGSGDAYRWLQGEITLVGQGTQNDAQAQGQAPERADVGPTPSGYDSVEAFVTDPSVIAAADAAGVTPEEMYNVYVDLNRRNSQ